MEHFQNPRKVGADALHKAIKNYNQRKKIGEGNFSLFVQDMLRMGVWRLR